MKGLAGLAFIVLAVTLMLHFFTVTEKSPAEIACGDGWSSGYQECLDRMATLTPAPVETKETAPWR